MIDNISFQAKARTVDHLGREQIADCPTAISELWKNAFDAYSRVVGLDLFAGEPQIAVLSDDGHGMSKDEFVGSWLVVGTESKATGKDVPAKDRNGLRKRPRQGQKGIGRLSCANLGPTLMLISKRAGRPYVVSLLDWRLFENPYLNLSDVRLPVIEVSSKDEVFQSVNALKAAVLENINGSDEPGRRERIGSSWNVSESTRALAKRIEKSLEQIPFEEKHLETWPVWTGESDHGTAMMVSELNFDLRVQIEGEAKDVSAASARDRFFETLSSFVDPFTMDGPSSVLASDPQFEYAVRVWRELVPHTVIGKAKEFDRSTVAEMEHQIDGIVDEQGVFSGRVKAFGAWLDGECKIYPPADLNLNVRSDGKVGKFGLYIASLEFSSGNSTHTPADVSRYKDLAERYAGFMVFRDGLRVLPYGRTDNDYFKIDDRRSRNAGREFWNNRQMFGRVAIQKAQNPNLKDKAGREGLIDNRAAKILRELVSNILKEAARKYFGSSSPIRKTQLPDIRRSNSERKAAEDREKLKKRNSREFRGKLKQLSLKLPSLLNDVEQFAQSFEVKNDTDIENVQKKIETYQERLTEFTLTGAPKKLGSMASKYEDYRSSFRLTRDLLTDTASKLEEKIQEINPADPLEILTNQVDRGARAYLSLLGKCKEEVFNLQRDERARVTKLFETNRTRFADEAAPIVQRFKANQVSFAEATKQVDDVRTSMHGLARDLFDPYKNALEILQENIDLDHLIKFGLDEAQDLRGERDRLTNLAQLGIAVEISGHELQDYDDLISSAFAKLPKEVKELAAVKDIQLGVEGLTDQLRFLSPLRLAGQRVKSTIRGEDIYKYLSEFFALQLSQQKISFDASKAFRGVSVFDHRSRLFPVFVNLMNNSIYWVGNSQTEEKRVLLDVIGDEVVVSDNGPGVAPEDEQNLFTLFFTKKARGGRGVGLYLSKANLNAAGHSIRYQSGTSNMPLSGANFLIKFEGVEFG